MKVFISSLIGGYGDMRTAARTAVETLRHVPVMAEDFGARASSPQVSCLQGVRDSDVVVLLLGEGYGAVQPGSGLSATHEEYDEAKGRKPVLAFVQNGVDRGAAQRAFLDEVQGWEGGIFRAAFDDPASLQAAVTRALHDHEMAKAVAPLDVDEMLGRAVAMVGGAERQRQSGGYGTPLVTTAIACGPRQSILRPAEVEAPGLAEELHREGLFGAARVFDPAEGIQKRLDGDALVLEQKGGASLRLDEAGTLLLQRRLPKETGDMHFPVIVEEGVEATVASSLAFAAAVLDRIDGTQRLTHAATAVLLEGSEHMAWKTRSEVAQAGNVMTVGTMGYGGARKPVTDVGTRAALRLDRGRIVEDLVVKLRRSWRRDR